MAATGFSLTSMGGRRVLYVMAAEAEYGPCLREKLTPLMTGIGPVEAAIHLAAALARLELTQDLPDLVVSLGSAGARYLEQARVYQVCSVEYRDMDASALGFPKGETPLLGLPRRIDLPLQIPGLAQASIATGASVVSGAAYDGIEADMVDMETFAVLRACQSFGLPLIGLRGISDGVSDLTGLHDWTEYLEIIDARLADVVEDLELALAQGLLG